MQERLKADRTALRGPLKADQAANVEREWRYRLIAPALAHPRHSEERAAAIRAVVAAPERHPIRGAVPVSERTLQRWISDHDNLGLGGLQRRKRKDVGTEKVLVSATWDRSVPFDRAVKERVAALVRQDLRNLWGNGNAYSVVRRIASDTLMATTRAHGYDPGPDELARICRLPKSVVEKDRAVRRVHQFKTDRKSWNDRRGRVKRGPDGLEPMQLVLADVHHVDVLLARPDGSTATPKLIAWMDVATHRVRVDLVLCEPGTAVRNEDLMASFLGMVEDPEWGVPGSLGIDNGSEFRFADFLTDVMKLANMRVHVVGEGSPIKRATPYEGASKGLLEGSFRILKDQVFAIVEGFIGGERMDSKSASLGRPQVPFSGGFEAFTKVVLTGIAYHNTNERRGALRGRTPDQVFRAWIERGWKRTDSDPDELMMAFSVDETRKVRQGKITVSLPGDPRGSITYVHDLLGRFEGETVRVRLPKFTRWPGIPVYSLKGERIGVALPEEVYAYNDPAGAIEARRRKRRDLAAIREEGRSIQPVDMVARMEASAAARRGAAVPESGGVISLNGDWKADAEEMKPRPFVDFDEQDSIRRAQQAREKARREKAPSFPQLFKR